MKCDKFLIINGMLSIFLLIFLTLISDNAICMEKAYTPKVDASERKAILDTLREGLKNFPDSYGLDFQYRREDVKIPADVRVAFVVKHLKIKDEWAWIEADVKDYCCFPLFALFQKKAEKWQILGIINFQYVVCPEKIKNCIDIKGYFYKKIRQKFPSVPAEIFPELDKDRKEILIILSELGVFRDLPDTVFVVNYLKIKDNWAWIETYPRTIDGMGQYEPINALLRKIRGKWLIKNIQPCCGECEEDPYCAKGIYHKKMIKMFPQVPKEIFPNR